MTKSLLLLLALIPFVCFGQINFKLNGNGCFETQDGKDYVVVNYDGKNSACVVPQRSAISACVIPCLLKKISVVYKIFRPTYSFVY